ncbi:MAG TPA: hypothetical protein VNC84_03680 [Gammaproteobacteria bacterium]|jgi:hypothetical protein|nr:hypothetical protein [Gammaproteobacteria bacterium]
MHNRSEQADVLLVLERIRGELEPHKTIHHGRTRKKNRDLPNLLPENQDKETLLENIKNAMHVCEKLKYTNPPYASQQIQITLDNKEVSVLHVRYNATKDTDALRKSQLDRTAAIALHLRKLSIIGGILNLSSVDQEKTKHLIELANAIIAEIREYNVTVEYPTLKNPKKTFDDFITNDLLSIMKQDAGAGVGSGDNATKSDDQILNEIRKMEKYFVADLNAERILMQEFQMDSTGHGKEISENYIQIEIPYGNRLTAAQREEYFKIHGDNKPKWFNTLTEWEKDWLIERVPRQNVADNIAWENFEKIFQSSAMQNLPGLKNARMDYLLVEPVAGQETPPILLSRSAKSASPVPYEVRDQEERERLTALNIEQQMEVLAQSVPPSQTGTLNKPTVLFHSLLADATIKAATKADKKLIDGQSSAIRTIGETHTEQYDIYAVNNHVNIFRKISEHQGQAEVHEKIKAKIHLKLAALAQHNDTASQKTRDLINNALAKFNRLQQPDKNPLSKIKTSGRNKQAFEAAYLDILAEQSDGIVASNCKSGKDRTGVHGLYVSAFYIYFNRYGKFPDYFDDKEDRKKFVEIMVQLHRSMKMQESAAANTPGSFGIKDKDHLLIGTDIICGDIADALGLSYRYSSRMASLNKPHTFERLEAEEKKNAAPEETEQHVQEDNLDFGDLGSFRGHFIAGNPDGSVPDNQINAFIEKRRSIEDATERSVRSLALQAKAYRDNPYLGEDEPLIAVLKLTLDPLNSAILAFSDLESLKEADPRIRVFSEYHKCDTGIETKLHLPDNLEDATPDAIEQLAAEQVKAFYQFNPSDVSIVANNTPSALLAAIIACVEKQDYPPVIVHGQDATPRMGQR